MADIIPFNEDEAFYRRYAREHLPDRPTREIIADLMPRRMLGDYDAVPRAILFAELAVKSEGAGA